MARSEAERRMRCSPVGAFPSAAQPTNGGKPPTPHPSPAVRPSPQGEGYYPAASVGDRGSTPKPHLEGADSPGGLSLRCDVGAATTVGATCVRPPPRGVLLRSTKNGGRSKLGTPKARRLTSGNPSRPSPTNQIPILTVGGDLPDAPPYQTAIRTKTAVVYQRPPFDSLPQWGKGDSFSGG